MASEFKPTEKETLLLQEAIDVDKRLENKTKNPAQGETHVFQMPNIENGVTNIGDLWDGRRSEALHHNILKTSMFTSKLLQASLINKCDTKFRQIKSHEDKIESLHIDANMSLEFLLGKIKLEGQFAYDNSTSSERSVDGILYNYLNEQYKIQLIPRINPSLLNRHVENMLKKGVIKATHVVGGMIIGAEVTAWIEATDTRSKKEVEVDGKGSGSFTKGILKCLSSLSGGAEVKESDVTNMNNLEVKVSVTARPGVEHSPTSLQEFLPFIQNLSKDLAKHTHFSHISNEIFGVPIRFILYPISQYVDLEIETLYQELTDACQKDFVGVIAKCNDLQQPGCIWKIILQRNHQLHFLKDSKSKFFKAVDSFEKQIKEFARNVLSRSRKALSVYKSGDSDMDKIQNIVREFFKNKASSVQEKAIQMADEGTKELQFAYFDATDEVLKSEVKRFTDRNECDIWLGKANPRLLLEIKPPCSEAIVKGFLDAAKHLISLKVDVAIAMPSISRGVCLTLRCDERWTRLQEPELIKALQVLNAMVAEGYSSIHIFYKVLGSLCSTRIPLCQSDAGCLDKVLLMLLRETYCQSPERELERERVRVLELERERVLEREREHEREITHKVERELDLELHLEHYGERERESEHKRECEREGDIERELESDLDRVCFVRSMCDLSTELALSAGRMVMCLPLGAPDTDLAVVKQFRSLAKQFRTQTKQDTLLNLKWIFCNFEVNNYHEAPLLLIFIKSEIVAACLDNLDILILMGVMNSKSVGSRSDFETLKLTPTRFANTMHPERAHYTLEIMSRINSGIRLSKSKISGFQNELYEESLNHLMMVIRATLQNDKSDLASVVAALVTGTFQGLSHTLQEHGLRERKKMMGNAHFDTVDCACKELVSELEKWKNDHSFETIVQETQQQLVELQDDLVDGIDTNAVFERIMNHDHCPIVVRTQLTKVISSRQSLKAKCTEVSNILNIDLLNETVETGCGHIKALIKVLQKSSQKELSPETIGGELAHLYSRRSIAVTENAMVEDELTRFLMPYQPYHILNTLHPLKHGQVMYLYKALEDLDSLDNSDAVAEIINTAWDVLNQSNSEVLWKNEQWLFLVRHCLKNHNTAKLIDSLLKWKAKISDTGLIPTDIVHMCEQSKAIKEVASGSQIAKINDGIIGHEYFFQACGEMYNIALGENMKSDDIHEKLIQPFAKYLIAGKAIELINGDSGEIPIAFFQSICRTVSQIRPGLRVFVMTLFELRMSQRSSLLSALFSCKYPSSIERHTIRSLFMRMIFLDNSVRETYGCDAIIVLNTESLRSQEVITSYTKGRNDVSRDWFSTIFAISLSNLIVVEEALCHEQRKGFERMTGVLFRLSEVNILPDLLISKSFQDTTSSTEALSKIVDETIREQLDIVDPNVDTSTDYARQLKNKLDSGTIYMKVPYLDNNITDEIPDEQRCERMHEDVTNLCVSLLRRSNSRGHKFSFEYWSQLLPNSWNCLKRPLYWLQLREAKEFHELTYYGKQIATAKELLTRTFLQHRNAILKQVRKKCWKGFCAAEICQQLETIPSHCIDKDCISCLKSASYRDNLYLAVKDSAWQDIVRISFQNHRKSLFESMKNLFEMDIKELVSRKNIAQNISKQITDELQNIRKKCPHGIFKHAETSVQVEAIWTQLLTLCAKDENEPSEEEQFALVVDELFPEWKNSRLTGDLLIADFKTGRSIEVTDAEDADIIPKSVVKDDTSPLTVSKMIQIITHSQDIARKRQVQTAPPFKANFNNLHVFKLSSEIAHVMSKFLTTKRFDCYRAGIKFELVMLHEFNDHIMIILGKFSEKFKLSISDDVKTVLQINILKILFDRIMDLQKRWNFNNGAFSILQQGAANYKVQISARLTSGFSNQAEGKLAARYLIMLMRQKIKKDEYDDKIASFLRIPWVANSETVRLRYFETLALEVFAGKKETALEHFRNPQASIIKWYRDAARNHGSGSSQNLFSSYLVGCLQKIRDCKDYSDLDEVLIEYETSASGIYNYERFQTEGDDFDTMVGSLKSELAQYSSSNEFEALPDTCIWENSEVRFRLGCTEECFRCGALCWNYLGHSDDEGELRKHYSCHQARGLATTSAGKTTELIATPCSQIFAADFEILSECCEDLSLSSSRSVSWKKIETHHLSDWKFHKNIASKYDDLMRWFFQELHVDIAGEKHIESPSESTLKDYCYCKLKLPFILTALRDETN